MFLLVLKSASPQAFQGPTLDTSCRGKEVVANKKSHLQGGHSDLTAV